MAALTHKSFQCCIVTVFCALSQLLQAQPGSAARGVRLHYVSPSVSLTHMRVNATADAQPRSCPAVVPIGSSKHSSPHQTPPAIPKTILARHINLYS